jgi:hypothetical protein
MHESHGDLLIGGERIKHVHCELEQEQPLCDSKEWNLAGHLHLTCEQSQLLETDRPYRKTGRIGRRFSAEGDADVANRSSQKFSFSPCRW